MIVGDLSHPSSWTINTRSAAPITFATPLILNFRIFTASFVKKKIKNYIYINRKEKRAAIKE